LLSLGAGLLPVLEAVDHYRFLLRDVDFLLREFPSLARPMRERHRGNRGFLTPQRDRLLPAERQLE
jgi:hypothetical protein